jgi:hypothetical protein
MKMHNELFGLRVTVTWVNFFIQSESIPFTAQETRCVYDMLEERLLGLRQELEAL